MCRVLQIAPSTWHEHARRKADPDRLPRRAKRDAELSVQIHRVFEENFDVYGVRKIWKQLAREGIVVARCTVARLMKAMGLEGVVRGKQRKTTIGDKAAPCPLDKVNRQFAADRPNRLWVSDFTYIATWSGFVYVAFVIDVYARRIVGWRASRTATAGFVLDALEQALHDRRLVHRGRLVHHSDSQRIEASSRASNSHSDGRSGMLAPQGAPCGLTRTQIDWTCLSPDLSTPGSTLR
jgi:transposase InsO family protein